MEHDVQGGTPPRRALVFAGGGAKVAYQAGVLQVWLDEARIDGRQIEFDVADGASAGVINLALWCQGRTGREIADAWRAHRPWRGAIPNLAGLPFPFRPSIFSSAGLRNHTLPDFGINWAEVAHGRDGKPARDATFNVWNATRQEIVAVPAKDVTASLLLAAISPPLWFPTVRENNETYTDSVFATDANLGAALRTGVTELWLVWTVSTRGRWRSGFSPGYFQILETAANSRLRADLDRVRRHNQALRDDRRGEFGEHPIRVRLLRAEVPVHYLLNVRRSSIAHAVDLGVRDARRWCANQPGIELDVAEPVASGEPADLVFRETLSGYLIWTAKDPRALPDGREYHLALSLTVAVRDVDRFIRDPSHLATATGTVRGEDWLETAPVDRGTLNILVDADTDADADARAKQLVYDTYFSDRHGRRLHLHGEKDVRRDGPRDSWPDTTTLYVTLLDIDDEHRETVVAAGVLKLTPFGFVRLLGSMRALAPTPLSRARTLSRFGAFFFGGLREVYSAGTPSPRPPDWLNDPVDTTGTAR
jgi:predicted acylesterase/phospholipase RssA